MQKFKRGYLQSRFVLLLIATAVARPICADSVLLKNAVVHTVSGQTLNPGSVLVRDGKIAAVGTELNADGAREMSLEGQHLYPGLIDATSSLGLIEIEAVRATLDETEVGEYTPDVEAWIAVNPDSELLPVARANGITHALAVPEGGVVAGTSGLMALDGWTTEQRTVRAPAALHVYWPNMQLNLTPKEDLPSSAQPKSPEDQAKERRKKIRALEDFFEDARAYAAAKKASGETFKKIPAWEAMLPVIDGKIPVIVHANEMRQIKAVVEWAERAKVRMIVAGGRDAWRVASLLSQRHVRVIYEQVFTQPLRDSDRYDVHFRGPSVLQQAGVRVIFSQGTGGFGANNARNLPYAAAQAVAFGFPHDEAIKAMTLYPAELFGVADRLGSIEPGKEASLVAADGDILDIRTHVKHVWIAGKEVSLENRQTRLYEKYRQKPVSR